MKGRSRSGFTPADFTKQTWLGESVDKFCDICGSRIVVDGRGVTHPCPFGPHEEAA